MHSGVLRWLGGFVVGYGLGKFIDLAVQSISVSPPKPGSGVMVISAPLPVVIGAIFCGFIAAYWPTITQWFQTIGEPPRWWRALHRPKTFQAEVMLFSVEVRRLAKRSRRNPKTEFEWSSIKFRERYSKWYELIRAKINASLRDRPQAFKDDYWVLSFAEPNGPANLEKMATLLEALALQINTAIPPLICGCDLKRFVART